MFLAVWSKAATLAKPVKCITDTTAGIVVFLLTGVLVLVELVTSAKSYNRVNSIKRLRKQNAN